MGIVLAAITRGARVAFCARHTEDRNRFWKRPSVSLDPVVTDPLTKRESIGILSPSYQLGGVRSMDPRTVGCPDSAGPGKGQAGAGNLRVYSVLAKPQDLPRPSSKLGLLSHCC